MLEKQNKLISRDAFKEFTDFLVKYRKESDFRGGRELVDRLETLLKTTLDSYFVTIDLIYRWCDVAINNFQTYLQRLQHTTKAEAMKQHRVVARMLEDVSDMIPNAQQKLQETSLQLYKFSDFKLMPRLNFDFDDYSFQSTVYIDYTKSLAEESKKCVLFICWETDETHRLKATIRESEENLAKATRLNNELREAINRVEQKAQEMKTHFETESGVMAHIRSQARITLHTISTIIEEDAFDPEVNDLIVAPTKNLIEECRKYKAQHEPLK